MKLPIMHQPFVFDTGSNEPLDLAIVSYLRRKYGLVIGQRTAGHIRSAMGSAMPLDEDIAMDVRGRDLKTGLPHTIKVVAHEVTEAMTEPLDAIVGRLRSQLETLPPVRLDEVIQQGVILTGEISLLRNLTELMQMMSGLHFFIGCVPDGQ